ncbi:MAG: hypothetical protein MJZ81_09575 [Bacteroidales bacterium]|nr:hypothetical protein [Bacteroidales bacterium]
MNYYSYLRSRYSLDAQTLSAHDRSHHGGHFDPETMTCRLRDELDADSVNPSAGSGGDPGGNPSAEYDEVVRKYKGTFLWMKAPNGKPTRLTERQWVQVRTPSFKKWFGDWESSRLLAMAKTAWEDKKHIEKFSFAPSKRLSDELKRQIGHDFGSVVITSDCVRHIKKHHGDPVAESSRGQEAMTPEDIVSIPYLMNNFDIAKRVPEKDDKFGESVEFYKRINRVSAIATISRGKDKQFSVTAWKLLPTVSMQRIAPALKPNVLNGVDAEIVQKDLEEIKAAARNSSAIVDENGEPRVVYHGTEERFTTFDPSRIGSHTDSGLWGRGFYFSSSEDEARTYDRANGTAGAYFLKMTSPCPAADVKKVAREASGAAEELYSDEMSPTELKRLFDAEYHRRLDAYMAKNGFDGVVSDDARGSRPTEFVALKPNQIKSATDNIGNFDPKDQDTTK